jgi:hypothetical protein
MWNHPEYTGESNHLNPIFFFNGEKDPSATPRAPAAAHRLRIWKSAGRAILGERGTKIIESKEAPKKKRFIHRMYGKIMFN